MWSRASKVVTASLVEVGSLLLLLCSLRWIMLRPLYGGRNEVGIALKRAARRAAMQEIADVGFHAHILEADLGIAAKHSERDLPKLLSSVFPEKEDTMSRYRIANRYRKGDAQYPQGSRTNFPSYAREPSVTSPRSGSPNKAHPNSIVNVPGKRVNAAKYT